MPFEQVLFGLTLGALLAGLGAGLAGAEAVAAGLLTVATLIGAGTALAWVVQSLRRRELGVDVVALLALAGALAVGELLAGAVVAVMLTGGRMLEKWAEGRARRDLSALIDRAYVVHYLRWVGYDLRGVRQTGSNFGEVVKHDTPFLSAVGSGTMVADGLSIINADFSSTSFRLSRVSIGAENFLGNRIAYPAQAKTGDNCLLATKVMVPLDGQVREGVGLLGAPSFEIPRKVRRDQQLDVTARTSCAAASMPRTSTTPSRMALMLLSQWIFFFVVTVLYLAAIDLWASLGALAFALATAGIFVFTVAYNVLVDRLVRPLHGLAAAGLLDLRPRLLAARTLLEDGYRSPISSAFNGTPIKNVLWRLLGVRIGRRVFDDGLGLPERTFTTIGDDCTFNVGSVIQCHSQEDGGFKSDRIAIGAGCTLGVGAWVHYGVTMGDGAVLVTDSFLMKGEEMPPNALWGGNPAKQMREHSDDLPVRKTSVDDNRAAVLVCGG